MRRPTDGRADETQEGLGTRELKYQTLIALPSPVVLLLMEQYSLSPLLAHREKGSALPMPHPISKRPTRPLSHPLYPGYKSGIKAPVRLRFSLELARCSNGVSRSNKLYREDPLQKEMASHSSILAWEIP